MTGSAVGMTPQAPASSRVLPMEAGDLDAVMALVDGQGWAGYSVDDLRLIMAISPEHCFKLVSSGEVVGSAFALTLSHVSYLSFFLIAPHHRSLAAAHALGLTCLATVRRKVDSVVAYANRRAVSAYRRHGFRPRQWVTRYYVTLRHGAGNRSHEQVHRLSLSEVVALDARCYRQDRSRFLTGLSVYEGGRAYGYRARNGEQLDGYAFVRRTSPTAYAVGPLVADSDDVAAALLRAALSELPDRGAVLELHDERLVRRDDGDLTYLPTAVSVRKMVIGGENDLEDERMLYAACGHHAS